MTGKLRTNQLPTPGRRIVAVSDDGLSDLTTVDQGQTCELCDHPGEVGDVRVADPGVCSECAVDLRADSDRMVIP